MREKRMTESQTLLQIHLLELGIKTEAEVQFMPDRKFRFDLANDEHKLGFECDGGKWKGGHMRGDALESQYEKDRLAQVYGWKIFRFTNQVINSGEARKWLKKYL